MYRIFRIIKITRLQVAIKKKKNNNNNRNVILKSRHRCTGSSVLTTVREGWQYSYFGSPEIGRHTESGFWSFNFIIRSHREYNLSQTDCNYPFPRAKSYNNQQPAFETYCTKRIIYQVYKLFLLLLFVRTFFS